MTIHLDWLTEIDGDYAYVTDGPGAGSLVVLDDEGSTRLPPYTGSFTILEEAASRAKAIEAAVRWTDA